MLAHDKIWSSIDSLALRNGLSASGLARLAGLDPTTFNKSKRHGRDGRPRWPSTESIAKILTATNTNVEAFFVSGEAPQQDNVPLSVPLLGEARAGELRGNEAHKYTLVPAPTRIMSFPDRRYDPLVALSVVGNSMLPLYRDGDVVFIAPEALVREGDRVVVKLKDSDMVVKILRARFADRITFGAAASEDQPVTLDVGDVEWVARIVYATQ